MALLPTQKLFADPVEFMKNNILIVPDTGDTSVRLSTAPRTVCLYWYPPGNGNTGYKRNFRKSPMPVYYIGRPGHTQNTQRTDGQQFAVYFCPYETNSYHGVVLGNACQLMLTTQMDGCSLGIGSRTGNGEVLVFHANSAAGNTTQAMMQTAQTAQLQGAFNTEVAAITASLNPSDYLTSKRGTNYAATTFGVRDAGNQVWHFYTQRFSIETGGSGFKFGWKELRKLQ